MDINQYTVFLKVASCENISQAAKDMNYTTAGVSRIIKNLEDECGFSLFSRTVKGVTLTDRGRALLPYIERIVQVDSTLQNAIYGQRNLTTGYINIGSFGSVSMVYLPQVIKLFHAAYPHININIIEGTAPELVADLKSGRIDIGIFDTSPETAIFDFQILIKDRLCVIVPKDHPLAMQHTVSVSALANHVFVSGSFGGDYNIRQILKQNNISPYSPVHTKDDFSAISMVENGIGLGIVSKIMLDARPHNVAVLTLNPPHYREIAIHTRSFDSLTPAAASFVRYCKKVITN